MLSKAQREKIEAIKREYEKQGLKEIKAPDGIWRPKIIGETFRSKYLAFEPDADNYHRNKYTFADDGQLKDENGRPVGLKGHIYLFGSITLDDPMALIPIGADVGIIYCGERVNPGFKQPTKLFTVMSDKENEITEDSPQQSTPKTGLGMDDPMAREMIRDCKTFLDSEGNKNPSILDIANYAEELINSEDEPNLGLLDNVQLILARDVIAECALSLTSDDNLNPSEEDVANCAKKLLKNNRGLLTKVQLLLAKNLKSKKEKEEGE
nr:hypothetical protein [uncultured Methanobacterium sp.]